MSMMNEKRGRTPHRLLGLALLAVAPLTMAHTCVFDHSHDDPDGTAGTAGAGAAAGDGGNSGTAGGGAGGAGTGGGAGEGGGAGDGGTGGETGGDGGAAGAAGEGGAAGAGGDYGQGGAGTGGMPGTGGGAGNGGTPPCESFECGDGCWDPATEECDDGNFLSSDGCGPLCAVSDVLVGPGVASSDSRPPPGRTLGDGRHTVAASDYGYAVVYVEPEGGAPRIAVRDFDTVGIPCNAATGCGADTTVGEDAKAVVAAHPVIAPLSDGEYMVAFVEFGGDGDGLGVAMQRVVPGEAKQDAVSFMNQTTLGAQYDPDLVSAGEEIVGVYVDSSNLDTAPDLRLRTFADGAGSNEEVLAGTPAAEFNVALVATSDGFAAAWRESTGIKETVRVRRRFAGGSEVEWNVSPAFLAPDSSDRPALLELDEDRLLLVYTDARLDVTGTSHIGRLRYAILDADVPGTVKGRNVAAKAAGYNLNETIGQGRPNVIRVGDELLVTWTSGRIAGDVRGEEVWLKSVTWSPGDATLGLSEIEQPLPREEEHRDGDQRTSALASMPYSNELALVCAWDDHGRTFGALSGAPDVVAELIPVPMLRDDVLLEVGE